MVNNAHPNIYQHSTRYDSVPLFRKLPYLRTKSKQEIKDFIFHYSFSILITIFSLLISVLAQPILDIKTPFLLFFSAVTLSAWYGGLRTGVFASILSLILSIYFLIPPYNSFLIDNMIVYVQLFLFLATCFLISLALEKTKKLDLTKEYMLREKEYARELQHLLEEQKKAKEEIKARDEFLSIASHELKTPLTSMLLQLQSILHNIRHVSLADFSIGNLMKMLESGEIQVKRLSKMINDMLNISLITTGRFDLELENVELGKLVSDVLESFDEKIKREDYNVKLHVTEEVKGKWDKLRIEQAVTNLISNAIKYGRGRPIEIRVEKQNNNGVVIVKDQGIGISNDKQALIFNRFERAVSEKDYKGLGVGLYITKQIVDKHGGSIKVNSSHGRGSIFTIELPIKPS